MLLPVSQEYISKCNFSRARARLNGGGLSRFLNFIVYEPIITFVYRRTECIYRNHPIIKEDGILAAFLLEPSLEEWRKHATISLEEEAMTKRVERVEEMSIPSDLEDKLRYFSLEFEFKVLLS